MDAAAGLDAGLFVSGEHEIAGAQRLAFPETLVEIQDGAGFLDEARVAWKDPGAMTPRAERVATEPSPDGGAADLGDQTLCQHFLADVLHRKPGQRQSQAVWQLTGEGLDLDDETGGKSGLSARLGVAPRGPGGGPERNASATC